MTLPPKKNTLSQKFWLEYSRPGSLLPQVLLVVVLADFIFAEILFIAFHSILWASLFPVLFLIWVFTLKQASHKRMKDHFDLLMSQQAAEVTIYPEQFSLQSKVTFNQALKFLADEAVKRKAQLNSWQGLDYYIFKPTHY